MDLTRLTRPDLSALSGHLRTLGTAADVLAEGGLEPVISITPEGTVLRAPSILGAFAAGDDEAGDCLLIEIDPVPPAAAEAAADAPPPPCADPLPAQVTPPEARPGAASTPAGRTGTSGRGVAGKGAPAPRGALSMADRQEIRRLHGEGLAGSAIAARLGLRGQVVGGFLAAHKRRGDGACAPDGIPGGQPAPAQQAGKEPVPAPLAPAGEPHHGGREAPAASGAPKAGGASATDSEMPSCAADAPHEGMAATLSDTGVAAPRSSTCPDDLRGERRRIWMHLDALGHRAPWDGDLDLEVVEGLAGGRRLPELALDLGLDARAIAGRFAALTAPIRDERARVSPTGQALLAEVLRRRLALVRAGAAGG